MNLNALAPRIFAGLVLGLLLGAALSWLEPAWRPAAGQVGDALGGAWLAGLRMTIIPLVFSLLFVGVARSADTVQGGGDAGRALLLFAILLLASAGLGAIAASAALRFWPIDRVVADALRRMAGPGALAPAPALSSWIQGLIPVNPIKAAADGAVAPLVVFALLFGIAATRQTPERRQTLFAVFDAIQTTVLTIVGWVMALAPAGVFFLALSIGARAGMGVVATLGQYAIFVSAISLIGALPAVLLGVSAGTPLTRLAAAFLPSQLMALSTQSSLATLPVMLRSAERLGVPERVRDLMLPMAVALFRATNPAANIAIVLYIAGIYGVALPLPRVLFGVVLAALVSLGGVGVASSVAFATVLIPLCIAMNLPIAVLPLLLSVEPILDFARTLGNVTADLGVTVGMQRWLRERPKIL